MELLKRARRGDLEGVKTLIQQRVPVNTTNHCNQTALYYACENGHTEVAQYLLERGAYTNRGAKPLIAAVRNENYDCVKVLIEHNAYINCTSTKGESPMSVALQKRYYSIILLLLQCGANPPASLNDIAVQLLKHAKVEHAKALQKLIDQKIINLTSESTFLAAFTFAFKHGSLELAERMLSNDSYSNIEQLYPYATYYSAKNNWTTVLSKLFGKGVDVNAFTDGETPLCVACKEGHESVVSLLLNNGANPNVQNKPTKAFSLPIEIAVQRGNAVIFDLLLAKGAKLNNLKQPLLHIACNDAAESKTGGEAGETKSFEHMLSIIRQLLHQGVDVNAMSAVGDTALYRACSTSQQLQVVQMLLDAGADVNLTSNRRYPLIAACYAGNAELINLLVQAGADVKCSNSCDETCLHAIIKAYSEKQADSASKLDILNTVKSLLEVGADVNARCSVGETALYQASKGGHEIIVRLLLEAGAEMNGSTSRRPLYAACERGYTQVVDLLLQHGADSDAMSAPSEGPNIPFSLTVSLGLQKATAQLTSGSLPLCCAVKKGYTDIVNLLVKYGANVNKQEESGKSALMYIMDSLTSQRCTTSQALNPLQEGRNIDLLKALLSAAADVNKPLGHRGHKSYNALHIGSALGMCDVMTELIQHGANCNQLTSSGKSAVDLACEEGHEAAVELLLQNGAKPDTERASRTSNSKSSYNPHQSVMPALVRAVKNDSETMVKMLLNHGANANMCDQKGNAVLHLATSNAVIETLLNAGANVNAMNENAKTTLSVVCEKRQADANVVDMLLKFGADPNNGFPLHAACKNDDYQTVRLLLAYGANANLVKKSMSERLVEPSVSPLSTACKNGNTAIVDCLLTNGAVATFADNNGNTPLHFAVERLEYRYKGNSEEYDPIVTLLLQHNAPVNVVSNKGESPLYVACTKGLTGVVKQLLDCRADVGLTTSCETKKYPLMIACEKKFRDIAMMLLDRGADANVSKDEQTPLKLASKYADDVLVKQLLSCGASINQSDTRGRTALHFAVGCDDMRYAQRLGSTKRDTSTAEILLSAGADANAVDKTGASPLCLACDRDNTELVKLLLIRGASPNTGTAYTYPIHVATRLHRYDVLKLLLEYNADVTVRDMNGKTAMHHVLESESHYSSETDKISVIVQLLLDKGADVNAASEDGESPFYVACSNGLHSIVAKMLECGAKVDGGNPNKSSRNKIPLIIACATQDVELVDMLLKHGADPNKESSTNYYYDDNDYYYSQEKLPLFVAVDKRNIDIITSLLNAGASVNATNHEGRNVVCFATEKVTSESFTRHMRKRLSTLCLLLQHGANFNVLLPDGRSPLYLALTACTEAQRSRSRLPISEAERTMSCHRAMSCLIELLQLMVKYGAVLQDSCYQLGLDDICHHAKTLKALATFDGNYEFIVDLFRGGAGFQLIASGCSAVATSSREAKSIRLCQAAVLAGYTPSAEELHQLAAASENAGGGLLKQLVNWLNEDGQQVPSLLRQCRVAIRRHLSTAVHYQTILPAIDELPLPNDLKLYLQFDGKMTEVDLSVNQTTEGTSAENSHKLSPYNLEHRDSDSGSSAGDYCDYYDDYYYSDGQYTCNGWPIDW